MVVCDEVVNTPTDGKERAVMDSFQGISLAPVDSTFSFVSFSKSFFAGYTFVGGSFEGIGS